MPDYSYYSGTSYNLLHNSIIWSYVLRIFSIWQGLIKLTMQYSDLNSDFKILSNDKPVIEYKKVSLR